MGDLSWSNVCLCYVRGVVLKLCRFVSVVLDVECVVLVVLCGVCPLQVFKHGGGGGGLVVVTMVVW